MKKIAILCMMGLMLLTACAKSEGFEDISLNEFHTALLERMPAQYTITAPKTTDRAGGSPFYVVRVFGDQTYPLSIVLYVKDGQTRISSISLRVSDEAYESDNDFLINVLESMRVEKKLQKKIITLLDYAEDEKNEQIEAYGFHIELIHHRKEAFYSLEIKEAEKAAK